MEATQVPHSVPVGLEIDAQVGWSNLNGSPAQVGDIRCMWHTMICQSVGDGFINLFVLVGLLLPRGRPKIDADDADEPDLTRLADNHHFPSVRR